MYVICMSVALVCISLEQSHNTIGIHLLFVLTCYKLHSILFPQVASNKDRMKFTARVKSKYILDVINHKILNHKKSTNHG